MLLTGLVFVINMHAYHIVLNGTSVPNSDIVLGRYYGNKIMPIDTTTCSIVGQAIFSDTGNLEEGLYTFILPNKINIDLLVGQKQKLICDIDPNYSSILKSVTGSETSNAFVKYTAMVGQLKQQSDQILEHYRPYQSLPDSMQALEKKLGGLNVQMEQAYKIGMTTYKGTILASIFAMLKDVPVPNLSSQKQRIFYLKNHYWVDMPWTDGRIVNTPMLEMKVSNYLNQIVEQIPDSLVKYATQMVDASMANRKVFKQVCDAAFSYAAESNIMGMDKLLVSLSQKYYLSGKAYWVNDAFKKKMEERVTRSEPTLLGNIAPNISLLNVNESMGFVSLHDVRAKATLLVFWEPNCGHCAHDIPDIQKITSKYDESQLTVFAVCTQNEVDDWKNFIFTHNLERWINVYDKNQQSNYKAEYDISGTPQLLLLDADKKIVAKQFGTSDLDLILTHYYKTGRIY